MTVFLSAFRTGFIVTLAAAALGAFVYVARADEPIKPVYVVEDNGGGIVAEFDREFALMDGFDVRIRGYCASACTRILFQKWNINVCAEDSAVFMFHMSYDMRTTKAGKRYLVMVKPSDMRWEKEWAKGWLAEFPGVVRTFLKNKRIPNIAKTGDISMTYDVKGSRIIKSCEVL